MRNKCLFSIEAVGTILTECYRNGTSCETGGALIGPKGSRNIVTHIIPSTSHAERQYAMYRQTPDDVAMLNFQLRKLQKRGFDYVGDVHTHPAGLTILSNGDRNTCREIFNDPSYALNGQLIMCIVTEGKENFPIYAYRVTPRKKGVEVERIDIEIMPLHYIEYYLSFNQSNLKGETNHEKNSNFKLRS